MHNTYFTLPVLFVMISNHYAMTYGARHNWLVLIAISFAGACIRAWFVARHKPSAQRCRSCARCRPRSASLTLAGVVIALAPPLAGRGAAPRARPGAGPARSVQADRRAALCALPCD